MPQLSKSNCGEGSTRTVSLSRPERLSRRTVLSPLSKYSLLSVVAGILFCKAEGLGPLSQTTGGLGSIRCFHRGGHPQCLAGNQSPRDPRGRRDRLVVVGRWASSSLRRLCRQVLGAKADTCPSVQARVLCCPADRPASTGAAPAATRSGRGSPGTGGGNWARPGWEARGEPGARGCRLSWSWSVDSVPRSHDSERWASWAPCLRGGRDPRDPMGLFGSLLRRCCVRGFQTL